MQSLFFVSSTVVGIQLFIRLYLQRISVHSYVGFLEPEKKQILFPY